MIRVLRLLEYVFEDYESAEKHFSNCWVPAEGTRIVRGITVRSTILVTPWSVTPDVKSNIVDR